MDNLWSIIISAVLSGILATSITLLWQSRAEKIKLKREIFITLMAYRFNIADMESVKALNCIQVVFFNNTEVCSAWQKFIEAAEAHPFDKEKLIDAHIKLLEQIAKVLRYKNIDWEKIKSSYYPTAIAEEINEEKTLRKAQINAFTGIGQSKQ